MQQTQTFREPVQAPARARFPAFPASWYLFCHTNELRRGPLSKDFLGGRLVAFRTESGRVAVLDARCSHLGADLGRGVVVGETIQCPYHHWRYGVDGRCSRIPTSQIIPDSACQVSYPVTVRHGFVFVFNGHEALFPMPFFFGESPDDFAPGRLFHFHANCPWYLVAGNGFDASHYRAVHDRVVIGDLTVDCPDTFARRIRYRAAITGDGTADRLLRRFVGETVDVSITSWAGPTFLVTARYRRACSTILIITRPVNDRETQTDVLVYAPRPSSLAARLLAPVGLRLRRYFTHAFMNKDFERLDGLQYNPHSLIESDREMIEFFDWTVSLPQTRN